MCLDFCHFPIYYVNPSSFWFPCSSFTATISVRQIFLLCYFNSFDDFYMWLFCLFVIVLMVELDRTIYMENKTRLSLSLLPINAVLQILTSVTRQEKAYRWEGRNKAGFTKDNCFCTQKTLRTNTLNYYNLHSISKSQDIRAICKN